jgi:phytoene dehydrogenase-like protein
MFLAAFMSALSVKRQAVHRKTAWLSRDFGSTCPHAEQRWLVYAGLIFSTRPGAFSSSLRTRIPQPEARMREIGQVLGPMLREIPARLGSRRPAGLARQGMLLRHLRKLDVRETVDVTRLLTGSIADLLDPYFESDAVRGLLSVSGVIGAWAGPRSAGTGYLTLHHHIGDVDGQAGAWGFPRGGMGGVTSALAGAARSFGAEIRTGAAVARIRVMPGGQVAGVTLASGEEVDAGIVVATAHPKVRLASWWSPRCCRSRSSPTSAAGRAAAAPSRSTWRWTGCRCSPVIPGSTRRCMAGRSCSPRAWATSRTPSRRR